MTTSNRKKAAVVLILMAFICSFVFSACKNVNVDEPMTKEKVNSSSVNAAEGFIHSVFTGDEELFYACFPENSFGEDLDAFAIYDMSKDADMKYIGVKYVNFNKITEENGYDPAFMKTSINLGLHVDEAVITDMEIVKLDVCFEGENNKEYKYVSAYVVTFQIDNGSWYAFEIQNSDAEFAA
ncbi:MAG: hypothetical protein MJ093_09495 [Saccharofermentans sp.]|nr:hypothetical protein [Saccharofermentans sp.]